jgi:hypothetical protein
MTAQEYIEAAHTEIGVLVAGGSLTVADLAWGLSKLNRLLKSVSVIGVPLHLRVTDSFSLVSGTASYTIGSGATINTARPIEIEQAYIRVDNVDYPVHVRPMAEYHSIATKNVEDRPRELYYDPTYPNGTIYLYYTPSDTDTMYLVSKKPLTTYASAATEVVLPGEYEDAVVLRLAILISSRFGRRVSSDLRINAVQAWNAMIGRNMADTMKSVNVNIVGGTESYDINTG